MKAYFHRKDNQPTTGLVKYGHIPDDAFHFLLLKIFSMLTIFLLFHLIFLVYHLSLLITGFFQSSLYFSSFFSFSFLNLILPFFKEQCNATFFWKTKYVFFSIHLELNACNSLYLHHLQTDTLILLLNKFLQVSLLTLVFITVFLEGSSSSTHGAVGLTSLSVTATSSI